MEKFEVEINQRTKVVMTKIVLITAIVATVLSACSPSDELIATERVGTIGFTARVAQTRLSFVETGFTDGDVIGVMGYEIAASGEWQNNETPDVMHDVQLMRQTYEGVANYAYQPLRMWPDAPSKARFFAYYPHSSSVATGTITPSPASFGGYPYVAVALGVSPEPIDFLVAQTDAISNGANQDIALNFTHQLAKLKFRVKATGLETGVLGDERRAYLSQLKIKNAFNKSVYVFDASGGYWDTTQNAVEGLDAVSGATLKISPAFVPMANDWEDLIDPYGVGSYLLMIPQTVAHIELEVEYIIEQVKAEGGYENRIVSTKKIPISVDWKAGQEYTYFIEFAFSEIKGDNLQVGFTVTNWKQEDIPTTIE